MLCNDDYVISSEDVTFCIRFEAARTIGIEIIAVCFGRWAQLVLLNQFTSA